MQTDRLGLLIRTLNSKWLFGAVTLLFLFSIARLIPPVQSPDEHHHLYRAQMLSMGQWLLRPEPELSSTGVLSKGSQVGGWVDRGLMEYKDAYWPLVVDPQKSFSAEEQKRVGQIQWQRQLTFVNLPGAGYYFPLIYAPQALGLALGRWLDLGVHASYWLCRTLTTLTCFALLVLSWRILSPPPLAWGLLSLPMAVFQLLSPTIDGLTMALSVLILSLFVKISDGSKQAHWTLSMGFVTAIFMVVTTRAHLLVFLVLPLFWAYRLKSSRDLWMGLACTSVALLWVAFGIWTTHDGRVINRVDTTSQLLQYLANPVSFFQMVWMSLSDSNTFLHYQRSFIGILGWLNVLLPEVSYALIWSGLLVCTLLSLHMMLRSQVPCVSSRGLLFILGGASSCLVFLAMLITWTPADAALIEGVQGRYFTVPALMAAFSMATSTQWQSKSGSGLTRVVLIAFAAVSFASLILALLARYD
jgi:uncharacterized membrane protein